MEKYIKSIFVINGIKHSRNLQSSLDIELSKIKQGGNL